MGYPELPFTTFQGLLDDGTYRLGVLQSSAELDYFEVINNAVNSYVDWITSLLMVINMETTRNSMYEYNMNNKNS